MTNLATPYLSAVVTIALIAALVVRRIRSVSVARNIAIASLAGALVAALNVLREVMNAGGGLIVEQWNSTMTGTNWFAVDGLSAFLIPLVIALALITVIAAPRSDANQYFLSTALLVVSATVAIYSAGNLLMFLAGWILSLIPFLQRNQQEGWSPIARYTALGSLATLTFGVLLNALLRSHGGTPHPFSMNIAPISGSVFVSAALAIAALLRIGVFPAHRGVIASLSGSGVLQATLLMNGHAGLYLLARSAVPALRTTFPEFLPWIGGLALITSLYLAVLGLSEKKPQQLLATVFVSQTTGLVAGMTSESHEGVTGALLQWIVIAVCSVALIVVYRGLQLRTAGYLDGGGFFGLGARTPRLAVIFAVAALALAGTPGTLGFSGEDLLMHGALTSHGWFGALLPVALVLNAFHIFKLFARLFMGEPAASLRGVRDALPRERWALSVCLVLIVWLGVAPSHALNLRVGASSIILGTVEKVTARTLLPPQTERRP
jgi:NADH-quinone oxidoreductase subunit M